MLRRPCGPFLVPSAYSNYLTDEGEAITRQAYGPNYDRLVALKKKVRSDESFPHEPQHQARIDRQGSGGSRRSRTRLPLRAAGPNPLVPLVTSADLPFHEAFCFRAATICSVFSHPYWRDTIVRMTSALDLALWDYTLGNPNCSRPTPWRKKPSRST